MSIMKMKFNKQDFELLLSEIKVLPKGVTQLKCDKEDKIIEGRESNIGVLLERITEILADKGFDENDELNLIGSRLESMIDTISAVYYF